MRSPESYLPEEMRHDRELLPHIKMLIGWFDEAHVEQKIDLKSLRGIINYAVENWELEVAGVKRARTHQRGEVKLHLVAPAE